MSEAFYSSDFDANTGEVVSRCGSREKPLSVFDLTARIKAKLEINFSEVVVTGEVSNFKAHPSGHHYFSLKDEKASLSAVMFRGANSRLKFKLENGQKVIGFGKISVYPPRGSYQIVLSHLEPEGLGSLQLAFEQLKKKLEAEGLFSEERKKPIPKFPRKVAVVTAQSGAAIRDILNVLNRRFAGLEVLIYPVKVQGEGSAEEVATAIQHLNNFFPEVETMIVGRGGGSIEDLWAFNEEVVARAIAESKIPIISAVGHEVDFTIADFVADLRAPTPSAGAELVVSNRLETLTHLDHLVQRLLKIESILEFNRMKIDDLSNRLARSLGDKIVDRRTQLQNLRSSLVENSPFVRLKEAKHKLMDLIKDLQRSRKEVFENKRHELRHLETQLKLLNPKSIMERGYSIVRLAKSGKVIRKASEVRMGDPLLIELSKGKITAKV